MSNHSKKRRWLAYGILVLSAISWHVRGDNSSTFANFAPGVGLNAGLSFNDPPAGTSGSLAFDPNSPSTLYINNRSAPAAQGTTSVGGVYVYNTLTKTRITNSSGPIYFGTTGSMTWSDPSDPKANLVGNDGSLYVGFSFSAAIYKISNPLSDAPTATKVLGNYNNSGDDDPASLARMPAGFGLANYSSSDLIMFDSGVDANNVNAIVAVHSDGSDATSGNQPTIVWKRSSATNSTGIYGGTDANSGYAYWINTGIEHLTIDGTDRPTIRRVKGDGVLQSIGLVLPDGVTLTQADEAMAVNPRDGSIWFCRVDPNGTTTDNRTFIRVDTSSLTATSDPNQFLANAAIEFTATGFNLGLNGLTFTPDGYQLYASTPTGTDKIWVIDVPEPAAVSFIAMGAIALLGRRRRHHFEGDVAVVK